MKGLFIRTQVLASAIALGAVVLGAVVSGGAGARLNAASASGLTSVQGIKVGHAVMKDRPTGCTVVLLPPGTTGSVDVRGGAPATKETELLNPVNMVQEVHAIVLSGGSAYGLDSATGVMRYLEEQGIGYQARNVRVPIVPAASLIDLWFGGSPKIRPDADCGYRAAQGATTAAVPEGNVGAGAGATVGKLGGPEHAMKAGLGTSAIVMPNGLVVAAIVAVNAVGDVIDPSNGQVVAGVRTADGTQLADARRLVRSGEVFRPRPAETRPGENTTIGVIATNAKLTKVEAQKIAQMAHDGYARAISPIHTQADGDTIFSVATGSFEGQVNLSMIGALAADAMADAIVRAATEATSLGGLPSARDIKPKSKPASAMK
jgi:L-aminopeptidase/D-esterase-like protein